MTTGLQRDESEYGGMIGGRPQYLPPLQGGFTVGDTWGAPRPNSPSPDKIHHGVDLKVPDGATIYAVRGGTVSYVNDPGYGGYTVRIDHGDGTTTSYAHMPSFAAAPPAGSHVNPGAPIGVVGHSGNA